MVLGFISSTDNHFNQVSPLSTLSTLSHHTRDLNSSPEPDIILPPVGIFVGIIGGVLNMIGGLFKSKEQKRREAVQQISSSLYEQVHQQKQTIIQQAENNLEKYCSDVTISINNYFDELIQGLEAIAIQLKVTQNKLNATVNYLHQGYAKRIIDWSLEQYEILSNGKKRSQN